jgi:hypothetical protein
MRPLFPYRNNDATKAGFIKPIPEHTLLQRNKLDAPHFAASDQREGR